MASDSLWPRGLQPTGLLFPWDYQAGILDWVAISSSRGFSWPGGQNYIFYISYIDRQVFLFFFLNHWTTLEGHVTLYSAKSLPLPASLMTLLVKYLPAMWETWVWSPGEGKWLPVPVFWSGEFHILYSSWGHKNWTRVSDFHFTSLYFTRWTTQMNTA